MASTAALDEILRTLERTLLELSKIRREMRGRRRDKWPLKVKILEALYESEGDVREAAKRVKRHHTTLYRYYKSDSIFSLVWDWAVEEGKNAALQLEPMPWAALWPEFLPEDYRRRLVQLEVLEPEEAGLETEGS